MKYLTFLSAALSLTMIALLVVIGIKLDVLMAGVMKVYMLSMAVAFASFIVSLVMLIRQTRHGHKGPDPKDGKKSGYAPSSFSPPPNQ